MCVPVVSRPRWSSGKKSSPRVGGAGVAPRVIKPMNHKIGSPVAMQPDA